jgi:hypothetical protein
MNEQDFGRAIGQHLDAGLDELPPSVLYRLDAARATALARARDDERLSGRASGVDGRTDANHGYHGWIQKRRLVVAAAAVLFTVLGLLVWYQKETGEGYSGYADFADVDTEVLTDDLPVVAYLDPGFEIWLYHSSPARAQD